MGQPAEQVSPIKTESPRVGHLISHDKFGVSVREREVIRNHPWSMPILQELFWFDRQHGTYRHSRAVGRAAAALLAQESLQKENIPDFLQDAFILAATLHDNGKKALGEQGKQIVESPVFFPPGSDEIKYMQSHVPEGYDTILHASEQAQDRVGRLAAVIMATHHEYQNNGYGVAKEELAHQMDQLGLSEQEKAQVILLQRYLAALDQAVGLAQGGEGGHASVGAHSDAQVRDLLNHEKGGAEKDPQFGFEAITENVMAALHTAGIFDVPRSSAFN